MAAETLKNMATAAALVALRKKYNRPAPEPKKKDDSEAETGRLVEQLNSRRWGRLMNCKSFLEKYCMDAPRTRTAAEKYERAQELFRKTPVRTNRSERIVNYMRGLVNKELTLFDVPVVYSKVKALSADEAAKKVKGIIRTEPGITVSVGTPKAVKKVNG